MNAAAFHFRQFNNSVLPNFKFIPYRRQQQQGLPAANTTTSAAVFPPPPDRRANHFATFNGDPLVRLPSILTMRLCEWIDLLTHPMTGAFPNGLSPKQMDQLAHCQVTRSSLEHGIEFRPLWKTGNHLGVLLWNEVKAGRIFRLHKACYVGKTHKKLQQTGQPVVENGSSSVVIRSQESSSTTQLVERSSRGDSSNVKTTSDSSHQQHWTTSSTSGAVVAKQGWNSMAAANRGGKVIVPSSPSLLLQQPQHHTPAVGNESGRSIVDGIYPTPIPSVRTTTTEMNKSTGASPQLLFRCFICQQHNDHNDAQNISLICRGCSCQSHLKCSYSNGIIPISLLNGNSSAVTNWRCYDCKCCHLCSNKDEASDDLLLCDGCDSGEHMGCQNPPISIIPPAPWYCSICQSEKKKSNNEAVISRDRTDSLASSHKSDKSDLDNKPPTPIDRPPLKIDERPISATSSTRNVSDSARTSADSQPGGGDREPATQSAWVTIVHADTPPLSDGGRLDSPLSETLGQQSATVVDTAEDKSASHAEEKQKPIKIKLGKRPQSSVWERSDSLNDAEHADSIAPKRRPSSAASAEKAPALISNGNGVNKELEAVAIQSDGSSSPSLATSDTLPSLNGIEQSDISGIKTWSVEETMKFFVKMGYKESAEAFKREEIDGPALLLLQRHDVLHTLGIRLGPALKTYKVVRFIQTNARPKLFS